MSKQPAIGIAVSATGQTGTGWGYLSAHYAAFRPEYEAMLRSVGIRPGWRVLDAGCGGGDFLPLLADLVGPRGAIVAVDLAEDNVAIARQRVIDRALPCPVDVRAGSVTALDFPDAAFDAVWCANTLMYLTDEETDIALAEFRHEAARAASWRTRRSTPGCICSPPRRPSSSPGSGRGGSSTRPSRGA